LGEGRVNEVNGGEVLLHRRRRCCKTNWQQDANATAATAATSPQNVAETSPPRLSIFPSVYGGVSAQHRRRCRAAAAAADVTNARKS